MLLDPDRPLRQLHRPRVDEHEAASLEVARVAGREGRLARVDDAGNLDIANLDGSADLAPLRSDTAGSVGRNLVKRQNSIFQVFFENLREGFLQLAPAPAGLADLYT